jgi:hypothetical protein
VEHPKKVLCISFVADDQPADVLQPGKQSFNLPAAPIPPQAPKILCLISSIATVMRSDWKRKQENTIAMVAAC